MPRKYFIILGALFAVLGLAAALATFTIGTTPISHKEPPLNLQEAPMASLDGAEVSFAELPPMPRLVNFWATWCAPCVHEMPLLDEAATLNSGVHFSGIAIDHADLAKPFVEKIGVKYDIYTPKFNIFFLFEQIGNKNGVLPYTLLLDAKGKIVASKTGEFHSAEEIGKFISDNLP